MMRRFENTPGALFLTEWPSKFWKTGSNSVRTGSLLLGTIAVAVSVAGSASAADTHERGTVAAVDGANVTVTTREGKSVSLDLSAGWKIIGVAKASMADIKQGTFIGTATLPATGDTMSAVEVLVFPEAMRGVGEGHYPWDLQSKTMMTNATVNNAVKNVDGQTVTLSYKGGEKTVAIKDTTPIVMIAQATKDDVKVGAKVFVSTPSEQDGKLAPGALLVGKDGVTPPM